MNVLITQACILPFSSTQYNPPTVLEIPAELYNENCMLRIGTNPTALLATRIPWSTLNPGAPPVNAM